MDEDREKDSKYKPDYRGNQSMSTKISSAFTKNILSAIIIALIIFMISIMLRERKYSNYIFGVWLGNINFMRDNNLSECILAIKKPDKQCAREYLGYLYIVDINGKKLVDSNITVTGTRNYSSISLFRSVLDSKHDAAWSYNVNLTSKEMGVQIPRNLFPKESVMTLSILDGVLTFRNNNDKFPTALLEKDTKISTQKLIKE